MTRTLCRAVTKMAFFIVFVAGLCTAGEGRTVYSTHGQSFSWNGYTVLNNQWGRSAATNSDWYQRIVQEDNNTVSFEYNWNGSTSQVKGYPVVMAGWHYGSPGGWMTPSGQKGFSTQIGANRSPKIVDREPGPICDDVGEETPFFSPDGARLVYTANRAGRWVVVSDGQESPAYDEFIGRPAFQAERLRYLARRGDAWPRVTQR